MTDEPVVQPEAEAESVEDTEPEVVTANCRHCGAAHEMVEGESSDWLCSECDKYQDTMACPECGQPTSISLMDPAKVPAPHAPQRRKKG